MTRMEALARLADHRDLTYSELDAVFRAYGFVTESPNFETEVYYHPQWLSCGAFTARDDGLHVVTLGQRKLVQAMLACIEFSEEYLGGQQQGPKRKS